MNNTSNVANIHNGHEFVDLGLPSGLLWATCNVGATSPEQAGQYFVWGETTGYAAEQVTGGERKFSQNIYDAGSAASISTDLSLEQDAAHANLGGKWRMPTREENEELLHYCYTTWTNNYNGTGVAGRLFTSNINGNSVFFPAAGDCVGSSVYGVGSSCDYWSASWYKNGYAVGLSIDRGSTYVSVAFKFGGKPIRAVCER